MSEPTETGHKAKSPGGNMAIMCIASAKGGVGKSTLSCLLGVEYALMGYKVALLDSDLNQHASAFGSKANIPGFTVVKDVGESDILRALRQAESANDIVMVDLPGGSSTLAIKALQRSHLVLIPTQPSLPDVRDAVKTLAQIDDAQELARSPISRAVIWTRFLPGFESRVSRHVRESLESERVPILRSVLMERAAYRAIHLTGEVPRQREPGGSAAINVQAIAQEVLGHLKAEESAA